MRVALVTETFLPKIDGVTRTLGIVLTHLRVTGHHALVLGPTGAPWRSMALRAPRHGWGDALDALLEHYRRVTQPDRAAA